MSIEHWLLIGLWALYALQHSWLASNKVKAQAQKLLKTGYKYYRFAYNVVAIIGLIGLLLFGALISDPRLWLQSTWITFVSLVLATYGVIVIRLAFKQYSLAQFLGFSTKEQASSILQQKGLLRFVRHPIYSGTLLITVGFVLFAPSITNFIHASCIILYTLIGVRFEENKLVKEFGANYREYQKRVPMLIPRIPWWK